MSNQPTPSPSRRLVAAARKTGAGPFVPVLPMSPADVEAHRAASHVRPSVKRAA
jgi:hypothetical protein